MPSLPLYNKTNFLGKLPVRVSTSSVRTLDHCHFHNHIQLCFVLSGEVRHIINGKEHIQGAGTCAFVLPYMSHLLDSEGSEDTPLIAYVWFEEGFLRERGYDFCSYGQDVSCFEGRKIPKVCGFPGCGEEAFGIIRGVIHEFDLQNAMSFDKIAGLVARLFSLACTEPSKKPPDRLFLRNLDGVNRAVLHILENYAEKLSTDELCEIAEMSRRSFTSHFKAITGLTVAEFILSVRLDKATQLLFSEDALYDDIAKDCGLCNHSNLSRVFVKYLGKTPTEYATEHRMRTSIAHEIPTSFRYGWLMEKSL